MDRATSMLLMTLLIIPMILFMPQIASMATDTIIGLGSSSIIDDPGEKTEHNDEKKEEKQLINNDEE